MNNPNDDDDNELWAILDSLKDDGPTTTAAAACPDSGAFCESCRAADVVVEDGQNICRRCCAILSRVIDTTAEWRFFNSETGGGDDPSRCGIPTNPLMPKSSLGSVIGGQRRDSRDMRRIRRFQFWNSMPHGERALLAVFDHLRANTAKYNIPSKVVEDAIVLYKKASELKISRGENKSGLIASCVFHACLVNKIPRSPKEISQMFNIDPMVLTKGNTRFQNLLKMNVDSAEPEDFVGRFASALSLADRDILACRRFVKKLDELDIVSESAPTSIAAGAIYYYCASRNINFTKTAVAAACNVSEMTLTKCFKKMTRFREEIDEVLGCPAAPTAAPN